MNDYDLSIQFLKILATLGGVGALILLVWWMRARPSALIARRQFHRKVDVEKREDERRKHIRLSGRWEHSG